MRDLITLRARIKEFRDDVEKAQKNGKIPADYSLGVINGLILCEHIITKKPGNPQYINRTTSVGNLPKPVTLNSGDAIKDTISYQMLMESIILQVRNLIYPPDGSLKAGAPTMVKRVEDIKEALDRLDQFVKGEKNGSESRIAEETGSDVVAEQPSNVRQMSPRANNIESPQQS
jgi:hypothetical protein